MRENMKLKNLQKWLIKQQLLMKQSILFIVDFDSQLAKI
ncbi:hypothetical protein CWATWH8502_3144 [Crocosphaera watsonii WH 8502]|uniref:Uncharacterized protein n=1 Tax=Crocosphaera watsonii WH 8502 TaxID=423474 RepID=T2ID90_CROWT|nr:hypothetical protein CWATWH8502_3144 [Crocosphaera watsonii WH 8502]